MQVDVHGEQAVKAGQFVVDLGAKIMHLKPVLELLVLGILLVRFCKSLYLKSSYFEKNRLCG